MLTDTGGKGELSKGKQEEVNGVHFPLRLGWKELVNVTPHQADGAPAALIMTAQVPSVY